MMRRAVSCWPWLSCSKARAISAWMGWQHHLNFLPLPQGQGEYWSRAMRVGLGSGPAGRPGADVRGRFNVRIAEERGRGDGLSERRGPAPSLAALGLAKPRGL